MRWFRPQQHRERFENVVSKWKIWPKRQVILEDFNSFELAYLIHQAGWEKLIAEWCWHDAVQSLRPTLGEWLADPKARQMHRESWGCTHPCGRDLWHDIELLALSPPSFSSLSPSSLDPSSSGTILPFLPPNSNWNHGSP